MVKILFFSPFSILHPTFQTRSDGTLPKSWDAYNKAQRIGCAWVNQRKPGQPCVDYWLNECRGRKPANIPMIHSSGK